MDARTGAARALTQVYWEGKSLSAALPPVIAALETPADRGLLQELCYGVMRWYPRLESLIKPLLRKPLKARDGDIHCLLLAGLYQLIYTRIPEHAAVSATVAATRGLDKPWAADLVNALLRNFQRRRAELLEAADADVTAALAHPAWLLDRIKSSHPAQWREILAANNCRPPMTLRINALKTSREDYLRRLSDAGIPARPAPHAACGIVLETPTEVERLPGFRAGWVSVQDGAAQLAAPLLEARPGQRVLDACAAPGGKTCHILEAEPRLASLTAIDSDGERLRRLGDNLQRLGLQAKLLVADAAAPQSWWDGVPYDRILLDAPCSATGVIRRHPDIKRLRRPDDIPGLVAVQQRLLAGLWPLLRSGGMLVYVTCSLLPEENAGQMRHFLTCNPDARERRIAASWGHAAEIGRQILPGEDDMDGFYFARIEKL